MKVSVIVMTYNHKDFIETALDRVLMQKTAFDYEIIVSEDCSADGTREIVLGYQKRFPKKFRLLLSEKNICSNAVVARAIRAAKGEYVALLDGDDYWTSPHKLQKQVDFLDRHPQCSMCFHNAKVIYENGIRSPRNWTPDGWPQFSSLEEIWMGNFIATCSAMFRRAALGEVPPWYDNLVPMITDWPLHILNAEQGKIGYIDEVMGVYRYHAGGLYSPRTEREKQTSTLDFLRTMNQCLQYKYDGLARTAISKYFF